MRFPRGRVAGPFSSPPLPNFRISNFGVIPKKGQPEKWCLILNLSSPDGASVNNDGIASHEFTLHYITVDQVIRMVSRLGREALMAKFVEAAYRNIPVHPADQFILGMKWWESYYVDLTLPFGLRSTPYIFNAVVDMVKWILLHSYQVSDLLHYLDDFITAGAPALIQCARNLSTALADNDSVVHILNARTSKVPCFMHLTDELMLVIWKSWDVRLPNHCMFWAACTLGYFGFLRSAEFTVPSLASFSPSVHLGVQDIVVDSSKDPSCICITIKASKTDPFHKGCSIYIGRGKHPLCAVHTSLAYLAIRGDRPGPLFLCQSGRPLSRPLLTDWLRIVMASAGVSGHLSSHSFRIGAATVAGHNGIPDHLIQVLGTSGLQARRRWVVPACQVAMDASLWCLDSLGPSR